MIKAVIFDMDGTVVETTIAHDLPVWTALFQDYNVRLSLPVFQKFLGKKASEILHQLVPGITDQQIETSLEKRDVLLAQSLHEKGLKTTPGFMNFLLLLQKKGILVALATGAGRKKLEAVCKYVPLDNYFPVIVTADDVARGKPHPDLFLRAAEKLGVNANECITVEDSYNGIDSSHTAGMKCIAIATTHTKDELKHADKIIDSFDELTIEDFNHLGWNGRRSSPA